jgi:hypothetical protein
MRAEDQADRKTSPTPADWTRINAADLQRRTRVAELFAAGCLSSAADFGTAALIFQHGDVPEHYLQAFFFASRAVALGDASQKDLAALAVDRYLMSTKHKQLFGSQASKTGSNPCMCLYPTESTFPNEERVAWVGKTLEQQRKWVETLNGATPECRGKPIDCDLDAAPTPKGSMPGVW